MIVEYNLAPEGDRICAPSWVLDGGYFQDPDSLALVGTWQNADVPDMVVRLTRQQLIDRVLGIHALHPMSKLVRDTVELVVMTDAEVTAMVEAWCDERGE
jgi:hypothetical protein